MSSKFIARENTPRWYGLSWKADDPSIEVSVRKEILETISTPPTDSPFVRWMMARFEFKSFDRELGFEEALSRTEGVESVYFKARLPVVVQKLNEPCTNCKGSGVDFLENKCLYCHGGGKKLDFRWKSAYALSASLSLLLLLLDLVETETSSQKFQLLTVELATDCGQHGGSLHGCYSIPLVEWLSKKSGNIAEMTNAMKVAYKHMLGRESRPLSFQANVHDKGSLDVTCPGDACGLNPSYGDLNKGSGYRWGCHNVDTPVQQLTLLAGLSTLHDLVDNEQEAPV